MWPSLHLPIFRALSLLLVCVGSGLQRKIWEYIAGNTQLFPKTLAVLLLFEGSAISRLLLPRLGQLIPCAF